MKTTAASSLEVLEELLPVIEKQEKFDNASLYQMLVAYVEEKGCKNGLCDVANQDSSIRQTDDACRSYGNLWKSLAKRSP